MDFHRGNHSFNPHIPIFYHGFPEKKTPGPSRMASGRGATPGGWLDGLLNRVNAHDITSNDTSNTYLINPLVI